MTAMPSPRDRVTRNGKTLSRRVWDLLADVEKETGIDLVVVQGAYNRGGVAASAGTHDGAGAFDLSVRGMTESQAIRVVVALRKRYVDAWLRSPKFGWPARLGGSHIHGIVADEPGLSAGARQQVVAYNAGRNGLASRAHDPFPRPSRAHFGEHVAAMVASGRAGAHVKLANLRFGKHNDDVKDLQHALHITADGVYGPVTDKAVRDHQRSHGWAPDPAGHSYVGPTQARALGLIVD